MPWVLTTFGRRVGRGAIRRMPRAAGPRRKEIEELPGEAKPGKRAEHVTRPEGVFARVRRDEAELWLRP